MSVRFGPDSASQVAFDLPSSRVAPRGCDAEALRAFYADAFHAFVEGTRRPLRYEVTIAPDSTAPKECQIKGETDEDLFVFPVGETYTLLIESVDGRNVTASYWLRYERFDPLFEKKLCELSSSQLLMKEVYSKVGVQIVHALCSPILFRCRDYDRADRLLAVEFVVNHRASGGHFEGLFANSKYKDGIYSEYIYCDRFAEPRRGQLYLLAREPAREFSPLWEDARTAHLRADAPADNTAVVDPGITGDPKQKYGFMRKDLQDIVSLPPKAFRIYRDPATDRARRPYAYSK